MRNLISRDDFGVLVDVYFEKSGNLIIKNHNGNTLAMTKNYPEQSAVQYKASLLVGKQVRIYTSQTTSNWSNLKWFCDIESIEK